MKMNRHIIHAANYFKLAGPIAWFYDYSGVTTFYQWEDENFSMVPQENHRHVPMVDLDDFKIRFSFK